MSRRNYHTDTILRTWEFEYENLSVIETQCEREVKGEKTVAAIVTDSVYEVYRVMKTLIYDDQIYNGK